MLENFNQFLNNDPKARLKIGFILGVCGFLVLILVSAIYFNLNIISENDKKNNPNLDAKNNSTPQQTRKPGASKNLSDQISAKLIKQYSPDSVQISEGIYTLKNKVIYFTKNGGMVINNVPILGGESFSAVSIYEIADLIIINEKGRVLMLQGSGEKDYKLVTISDKKILNLVPGNGAGQENTIFSLQSVENQPGKVEIKKHNISDVLGGNFSAGAIVSSGRLDGDFPNIELFSLSGKLFIFGFNNYIKNGNLKIYASFENEIFLSKYIENIFSTRILSNHLIITYLLQDENDVFNFGSVNENTKFGIPVDIKMASLLSETKIFGQITADKCDYYFDKNNILCMVKSQLETDFSDPDQPDQLVSFDLKSMQLKQPYSGVLVSAKYFRYSFFEKIPYLFSSTDSKIYKLLNVS